MGFVPDQPLPRTGDVVGAPVTAMAPNGYAIAAWQEALPGGDATVQVSVRPPAGEWSSPQELLRDTRGKRHLSVAVDDAGEAAVTWHNVVPPSTFDVSIATRA